MRRGTYAVFQRGGQEQRLKVKQKRILDYMEIDTKLEWVISVC